MPKSKILNQWYSVETWNENGWWLATVRCSGSGVCITQGRTKEELWDMIADAVITAEDIKVSWWNRLVGKFFIY